MLKLKAFFIIWIFLSLNLFAVDVIVNNKDIDYKELISKSKLYKAKVKSVKKYCVPVKASDFNKKKFRATRYLKKGTILCTKDIELDKNNSVLFNFGSIQIEKQGKIIFENDEYIRIKRDDGKIEKIYKDGRIE